MNWPAIIWIGLGGGIGSILRAFLSFSYNYKGAFPWGTWLANILSSLILGYLFARIAGNMQQVWWYWFLAIGFCGGFSTFSTFSLEILVFITEGQFRLAAIYIFSSLILAGLAIYLGTQLANP